MQNQKAAAVPHVPDHRGKARQKRQGGQQWRRAAQDGGRAVGGRDSPAGTAATTTERAGGGGTGREGGGTARLNVAMRDRGMCSRLEADDMIAKGWVMVNGLLAELGAQVRPAVRGPGLQFGTSAAVATR